MKKAIVVMALALLINGCVLASYSRIVRETHTLPPTADNPAQVVKFVEVKESGFRTDDEGVVVLGKMWQGVLAYFGYAGGQTTVETDKPVEPRKPGETIDEWRKRTGRD